MKYIFPSAILLCSITGCTEAARSQRTVSSIVIDINEKVDALGEGCRDTEEALLRLEDLYNSLSWRIGWPNTSNPELPTLPSSPPSTTNAPLPTTTTPQGNVLSLAAARNSV